LASPSRWTIKRATHRTPINALRRGLLESRLIVIFARFFMLSTASSSPLSHLLVVDDESEIADSIARYFGKYGFRVSTAADGMAMREIVQRESVDAILLDLGLPREDGFELTRWLREHWRGAIIIITGRGESVDRVVGLELGADDYVTKPFDLRELLARVRSVLRRTTVAPTFSSPQSGYAFSGFLLDPDRRSLTGANGDEVSLTSGEFDLLCVLVRHPNRVLSRDAIMDQMHGRRASGPFDRAIDVQIGRLRRKIEADSSNPQLIKSVRNVGYLFAARVDRV
jgi:DNA-binding response OmpR family regulator